MGIPANLFQNINVSPEKMPEGKVVVEPPPAEGIVSSFAKEAAGAFGEGLGRNVEFVNAMQSGEVLPLAAIRLFLPPEMADKVIGSMSPQMVDEKGKKQGTAVQVKRRAQGLDPQTLRDSAITGVSMASPTLGGDSYDSPVIGPPANYAAEMMGEVGKFVGTGASQPIPGVGYGKQLLASGYAGVGSAAAGDVAAAVSKAFGGGIEAQGVAKAGGGLAGAFVSGPANLVRMNAITEGAKTVGGIGKRAFGVASDAVSKRTGDAAEVEKILKEDYKNLSSATQGGIQQKVNEVIAKDIVNDPHFKGSAEEFDNALAITQANPSAFNLPQRSATPSLVGTVRQMRPETPETSEALASSYQKASDELVKTAKRITEGAVDPNAKGILRQLSEAQKTVNLQVAGVEKAAQGVASESPRLTPAALEAQGTRMQGAFEKELEAATIEKNKLYEEALAIPHGGYDLKEASDSVKDILKQVFSKIDPSSVTDSIRNLRILFSRQRTPLYDDIVNKMEPDFRKDFFKDFPPDFSKQVTLRDINDAVVALHADTSIAQRGAAAGDTAAAREVRNLTRVSKELEKVIQEQSPPDVIAAYNRAVENYRGNFVPRFKEGINLNLNREAGSTKAGRDFIEPFNIIPTYLKKDPTLGAVNPTSMKEFENLFGGRLPGTKRSAEAFYELEQGIQSKYAEEVLQPSAKGFDPAKHEEFLRAYGPALEKTPALRDRLDSIAGRLIDLKAEKARIEDRWEAVVGKGTLTSKLGMENVDRVFSAALSDPRKAGQLVKVVNQDTDGEGAKALLKEVMMRAYPMETTAGGALRYDPKKTIALLDAGKAQGGEISGLQVIMRAASGKERGDHQLHQLRSLALLEQRVEATNPLHLRPDTPFPTEIFTAISGQSGASWITGMKNSWDNKTSPTYFASYTAGRFFSQKLKESFNKAYQEALFNPEMADAIFKLATTPASDKIPLTVIQKVFGTSAEAKAFAKRLFENGMLTTHALNSARIYGEVKANEDETSPSRKVAVPMEPEIVRIR